MDQLQCGIYKVDMFGNAIKVGKRAMKKVSVIHNLILATVVITSLVSCGGSGNPIKTGVIGNDVGIQKLQINFPENDPVSGEKLIFDVNAHDFSNSILKLSNYKKYNLSKYKDKVGTVSKKGNIYEITYRGKVTKQYQYTRVSYFISSNIVGSEVEFTLLPKYEYIPMSTLTGGDTDISDSLPILNADVKNIFSNIDKIKLYMKRKYVLKGEENTNYPSESVYANFARKLGRYKSRYAWKKDDVPVTTNTIKKENIFKLNNRDKIHPLYIEVYPYRNGSKVVYSSPIRYYIDSKGNVPLTKSEIEQLRESIKSVVND